MLQLTQKQIKQFVKEKNAIDITNYSYFDFNSIKKTENENLKKVAVSCGIYGLNGVLLMGSVTNKLYAITSRNAILKHME